MDKGEGRMKILRRLQCFFRAYHNSPKGWEGPCPNCGKWLVVLP